MINYFFNTEVAVERPNKLAAKKRGDGPAFDVYYDGKKFSGADGIQTFQALPKHRQDKRRVSWICH